MVMATLSTVHDVPGVLRRALLRAPIAGPDGPVAPDFRAQGPKRALAGLLGLPGTVRIADHLALAQPLGETLETPMDDPLVVEMGRRLADIRNEAVTGLASMTEGRHGAPDAETLARALERAGAFADDKPEPWLEVGKAMGPDFVHPFVHYTGRARQKVRWIRADLLGDLRARGGRAHALMDFDSALFKSTEPHVQRLMDDTAAALERLFAHRLLHEGRRNAGVRAAADVALMYRAGGVVHSFLRDARELALGLVDRELEATASLLHVGLGVTRTISGETT